jgi:LmbE family N-acetylglucosaminyl deacetylase
MLGINFNQEPNTALRVLCLGAHSDDIEIGCGGTLLKLIETYPNASVHWIVFSANPERAAEAVASAHAFLEPLQDKRIVVQGFKDGFFPYTGAQIKAYFETLKSEVSPDLIFTHYRHDLHQDHRLLCELTWNTFRDHLILEYEIPKYDGDMGVPNFFVHLDQTTCRRKTGLILEHFKSQLNQHWFTEDAFLALLRLRGVESNAPGNYAEAFYCRKTVF